MSKNLTDEEKQKIARANTVKDLMSRKIVIDRESFKIEKLMHQLFDEDDWQQYKFFSMIVTRD